MIVVVLPIAAAGAAMKSSAFTRAELARGGGTARGARARESFPGHLHGGGSDAGTASSSPFNSRSTSFIIGRHIALKHGTDGIRASASDAVSSRSDGCGTYAAFISAPLSMP